MSGNSISTLASDRYFPCDDKPRIENGRFSSGGSAMEAEAKPRVMADWSLRG